MLGHHRQDHGQVGVWRKGQISGWSAAVDSERKGKATQVTFRQVSVVDQPRQRAGKCMVPSALFSYKHGGDVPIMPPAPAWQSSCASQHMNCWVLWPPDLENDYTRYYQMLVQIHWKPKLSIHSPLGMKETIDSFRKNHHIYIFLSWAQWMILIKPF